MKIYVVNCEFNTSRTLIDCAFQTEAGAKAYIDALNGDKVKAIARCKEIIALREGETMVKFLVEECPITFTVLAVELK
jgi:hypothetical protein